ncbi:MAG: L-Ala-D/L-Glu epimerase [Alphaproteobacteria bacterium]|nr:L-Ala-D/L-Glu epimerase [Alphaproteobacteria bacterium]
MRTLRAAAETWPTAGTFTISRGAVTEVHLVVAEIAEDGVVGRGECRPYPRYDETPEKALAEIATVRDRIEAGMDRAALQEALPPCAARNALDCALWDLEAKRSGTPVWQLAGLPEPRAVVTAYTISLDSPDKMAAQAAANTDRPLLKVKLGADDVIERLRAVRQGSPQARIVADANESWSVDLLRTLADDLVALGVAMIEQPLPAGKDGGLGRLSYPITLCADESFHDRESLADLAGRYRMVNVKLDKTGGLTEAILLVRAAQAAGFELMIGCMVATSLAMAPAALLAPMARVVDLDGPLILARDRVPGIRYDGGTMHPAPMELWG